MERMGLDRTTEEAVENTQLKRTFIPSLTLSYFSTYLLDFLVGLLLLDVTFTFFGSKDPVNVAITSQLATISSIAAVTVGIAVAFLSIRFMRKLLLLIGAFCIPIGVIGTILAPNFTFMAIFYPLDGIGSIIVGSMVFAIAGDALRLSKRGKAISLIVSGATWAQFIGALLIRYFFSTGDWRMFLSWYALPVSMFAIFFVYFGVPSTPIRRKNSLEKEASYKNIKEIFLNRSAMACLIGNMTRHAGMMWGVYSATFFRLNFGIPLGTYAIVASVGTLLFALGNITGGRLVDKVGRKRLVLLCFLFAGTFIAASIFIPNMLIALTFSVAASFSGGMGAAGSLNMTVEQVPKYRGTVMSMSSVFVTLGAAIGTAVGGAVLAFFGSYQILALTFVAFTFTAAGIYLLLTKDPCKANHLPI
jgi:predicted MFS family arabinose efflux permease